MRKVVVGLVIILVISLGCNAVLLYKNFHEEEYTPFGTFMYMPNNDETDVDENVYLVFDNQNKYVIYKQGDICLDRGKYETENKNIILSSSDGTVRKVVYEMDKVYDLLDKDTVVFERHSDVPAYINFKRN